MAVITNGTAVLGLGDIGPLAGKPVMEGKGCLFKKFAAAFGHGRRGDQKDARRDRFADRPGSADAQRGGADGWHVVDADSAGYGLHERGRAWGLIRESTGVLHDVPPLKRAGRAEPCGREMRAIKLHHYIW
ncbi:hypothetical protein AWV80_17560 [Cupriavidus sp. UYMU48A]|nr:hypothetical protein AWV80_17560 [Cupriavidus sp. UYMU48A]